MNVDRMIGTTVSHYKILEKIGGGGMGVVYKAQDLTLGRLVALKFLPSELAEDSDAMRRFEREARASSALNHPHICTIFELGREEGHPFLVMELLDGRTLESRIRDRSLQVDEITRLGIQVADALEAAHGAGIVHRDIKPANLFVTSRGDAKVLDFGLAKFTRGQGRAESAGPQAETAVAESALTAPGTAPGTVAYMSPEQVLGEELDGRTDLFSLGVVLYEMATGTPPFSGATTGAVFDQILHRAPEAPMRLTPGLPEGFERVLDKALEKDRALRYQTAKELAVDLRRLQEGTTRPETDRRSRPLAIWIASIAVLAAAVVVGTWLAQRGEQAPATPPTFRPFTADGGWKDTPRLSPDGERVAYAWHGPSANLDIWVKALGQGAEPVRLTDHEGEEGFPAFSPDGRQIAFARVSDAEAAIYVVSSYGGQERKLTDFGGWPRVNPALSWAPDGRWLAFSETGSAGPPARIVALSLEGLERTPITSPPSNIGGDFSPQYSPAGDAVAFSRRLAAEWGECDVWVKPTDGEARRLTTGRFGACAVHGWTADGEEILFSVWSGENRLYRVPVRGGATKPVAGVGAGSAHASVVGSRMVYRQASTSAVDIWRAPGRKSPIAEVEPERLISSSSLDMQPTFSPHGDRIAFSSYRSGQANIWLQEGADSRPTQLTNLEDAGSPTWAPDGMRVAFDSRQSGNYDLWVVDVDGGVPRQLTFEPSDDGTPSWSRDGRWIYFHSDRSGEMQIWRIPPEGGDAEQVTRDGGFFARESTDGTTLYVFKFDPESERGLWRLPVGGGEAARVLGPSLDDFRNWSPSGSGIYFSTGSKLQDSELSFATGGRTAYALKFLDAATGVVTDLFRREKIAAVASVEVSPDEKWILWAEIPMGQSELILVENFR